MSARPVPTLDGIGQHVNRMVLWRSIEPMLRNPVDLV